MAGIMRICAGLVGPKSEHVDFSLVFEAFLKGSKERRRPQDNERLSEPGWIFIDVGDCLMDLVGVSLPFVDVC